MGKFFFIGEAAALNFVNTEVVVAGESRDLLENFGDLVRWSVEARLITEMQAELLAVFEGTPKGEAALRRARELRGQLRTLMRQSAAGKPVNPSELKLINELLKGRHGHLEMRLSAPGTVFLLHYETSLSDPLQLVAHIAESASRLLCSDDVAHIKSCENPDCVLMFLDVSKNKKRRWCSMANCGNRHKVASHRQRKEQTARADA